MDFNIDRQKENIMYMAEELYKEWLFRGENLGGKPTTDLKVLLGNLRDLAFSAAIVFYDQEV